MPSTRRQKAKARRSREMDMLSDYDNLDVMLGSENNNPIERELAEAIDQSSTHGDAGPSMYHENRLRDYIHENESLRQNEVRQSFEAFSSEFNLRLFQEMDSMMSMMHNQINRAITTAIAERVIPEIQNIANSMSSTGHRDTEASLSPNSQENRENASGPKIKITKKDSRSVGDLRDAMGHGSYIWGRKIIICVAFFLQILFFWPNLYFTTPYFSPHGPVGSASTWQTRGHLFEPVLKRLIFGGKYPGA